MTTVFQKPKIFLEKNQHQIIYAQAVKLGMNEQLIVILQNNGTRETNIYSIYSNPYSPSTSGNSSTYHNQAISYNTKEQVIRPIQYKGNFVLLQR